MRLIKTVVPLLSLFFGCAVPGLAQQFKYGAKLSVVDTAGFYQIGLLPDITALSRKDYADVRVVDDKNQWVPHLLRYAQPPSVRNSISYLAIRENTISDSGSNLLIAENTQRKTLRQLLLVLNNTAVSRKAVISGSNDLKDWYIIDDNVIINSSTEKSSKTYLHAIRFPPVNFHYFKLVVNNTKQDPLLILQLGFDSTSSTGEISEFINNPSPRFHQKDSNHISYLLVQQPALYNIDKFSIQVDGVTLYNRKMELRTQQVYKNGKIGSGEILKTFQLSSTAPQSFEVPTLKAADFYLLIYNDDNPPLKITAINTHQRKATLTVYLTPGKQYALHFGDSLAVHPTYDLPSFEDSIIETKPLYYQQIFQLNAPQLTPNIIDRSWIWAAIIAAGLAMGFLAYRLTRELSEKNK